FSDVQRMPRVGAFFIVEVSDATGVCGASSAAPRAPPRPNRKAGLSASTASGSAGTSEAPSAAPRAPLAPRPPRPPPLPPRPPRPSAGAGDSWFFIVQAATNSSRCASVDQPFKLILIGSPAPLTFAVVAVKCTGVGACALIVAMANPSRASMCDGRIVRISISLLDNLTSSAYLFPYQVLR